MQRMVRTFSPPGAVNMLAFGLLKRTQASFTSCRPAMPIGYNLWSFEEGTIEREQSVVDELRRVEALLRRTERRNRILVENSLDVISLCSAENTFLYASPSVERVLGYTPEELIGTSISELVHPDDFAEYGQTIIEGLQAGSGPFGPIEARYRHKDGSWRCLETTMNVLTDDPDIGGIICVSRDVTHRKSLEEEVWRLNADLEERVVHRTEELEVALAERRETEEALRISRDELDIVLEGVADGILAQNVTGHPVYANEAAARILGYPSTRALLEMPPEEVMGKFEIMDEEGHPYPVEELPGRRAIRSGRSVEVTLRLRQIESGEERWLEVKATPVFGSRKEAVYEVNVFQDITERKRAEAALQEVRTAERTRIARDLHDAVLQDLTVVIQVLQARQIGYLGQDPGAGYEEEIGALRRSVAGLREAIYDLRPEIAPSFFRAIESLVELNRHMEPGRKVELVVREGFPEELPGTMGTDLLRVVQEALNNARRHSGANNIQVTANVDRTQGDRVVVEVADNGRGFEPGTASGVGFRSMRERAAAVGGTLEMESEPGQGTWVRVSAPFPRGISRKHETS